MMRFLQRIWSVDANEVLHHVEDVEERHQDIEHDLYVVKQRADILARLVAEMRSVHFGVY